MSYNISDGSFKVGANAPYVVTGTDVAVADGGTGSSTASGARANLGLDTMATQAAGAVAITGGTIANAAITGLATPSNAGDAANKGYVDAVAQALDPKGSVRVATAGALPAYTRTANVITASANGAIGSIDGVAVGINDRVLVKNGATGSDNGLYFVSALGDAGTPYTLTRTTDADVSAEVTTGLYTFASEGTANASTGWVLTTADPITLNTTALTFTQFSGAGQITAGNGLTKTGNTLDVGAGNGIISNADSITIGLDGGSLFVGPSGLKVQVNGITSTEIADNAVTSTEIAAGAVTLAKVARSASNGQIIIGQGAGADSSYQTIGADATLDGGGNLTIGNAKVTPAKADLTQGWTHTGALSAQGGFFQKVTVTTVSYTVLAADCLVAVTDTSAPRTITLPAVSGITGRTIIIKDASGAAGTNNITIDGNASETIDGALNKVLNSNYASATLVADVGGWYIA